MSRAYEKPLTKAEARMVELGRQRYLRSSNRVTKSLALGDSLRRYSANIVAWTDAAIAKPRPGLGVAYALILKEALDICGPDVIALTSARSIMEGASLQVSAASCAVYACAAIEQEVRVTAFAAANPYMFLAVKTLHKLNNRYSGYRPSSKVNQLLRDKRCTPESLALRDYRWPTQAKAHIGIVLLHLFNAATGYLNIDVVRERGRLHSIAKVCLSESYAQWKGSADERLSLLRPVLLPLPEPPKPWKANPIYGGYHAPMITLVKNNASERLYDPDVLLDADLSLPIQALDNLQATAWSINPTVADTLRWAERNPEGCPEAVVPPQPLPYPMPTEGMTDFRLKFLRSRYYLTNSMAASKRVRLTRVLETLKEVEAWPKLYFPCNMDYRSRLYTASSSLLSYQGGDVPKGLLELAEPEKLTEEGWRALKIHGANCFGLDKQTLDERLAWADRNREAVLDCGREPKASRWWMTADEPWQFLNFCLNYAAAYDLDAPCRTVAWADATSSGFQFIATLTGDEKLARLTNVVPSGERQDLYSYLTSIVIEEATHALTQHPSLEYCFQRGIDRNLLKPVVMAIPYGVSVVGMSRLLAADLLKWLRTSTDHEDRLDRYIDGAARLTTIIHNVVKREFPRIHQFQSLLQQVARERLNRGEGLTWTTPSGFPWRQAIPQTSNVIVRPHLAPAVKLWTEAAVEKEGTLDVDRNVSATPANFIHSLDAAVMHRTVALSDGPVAAVHDCIGTHPNRMETMKRLYRESFQTYVARQNPLLSWCQQNAGGEKLAEVQPLLEEFEESRKKLVDGITESRYFIS